MPVAIKESFFSTPLPAETHAGDVNARETLMIIFMIMIVVYYYYTLVLTVPRKDAEERIDGSQRRHYKALKKCFRVNFIAITKLDFILHE